MNQGGYNKRARSPRRALFSDLFEEGVCVTSGRGEPARRLDAWLSESPNKAFPTTDSAVAIHKALSLGLGKSSLRCTKIFSIPAFQPFAWLRL